MHSHYLYVFNGMTTNMTTHRASLVRHCYALKIKGRTMSLDIRNECSWVRLKQCKHAWPLLIPGYGHGNMTSQGASLARHCYALKIKGRTTRLHIHNECSWVRLKKGNHAWPVLISSYGHENKHDDTCCKPCTALLCI